MWQESSPSCRPLRNRDHLLCQRLALKLLQRQVAEQLGLNKASIVNWEANRTQLDLGYMPAIIQFLGYNPLPPPEGWADRLVQFRTALGITQKEAAERMGMDQCTLARWERGERVPTGAFNARVEQFLRPAEATRGVGCADCVECGCGANHPRNCWCEGDFATAIR